MQMSVTLLSYRNTIKKRLHISTDQDNNEWSNDYLNEVVNLSRNNFWEKARYHAKPTLVYITSAIGTAAYDLSAKAVNNIDHVRFYNGTSRFPMDFVTLKDYLKLTQVAQTGIPTVWTEHDTKLKVWPSPTAVQANAFEIFGDKSITDLSADADIDTDIDKSYKDLIVEYGMGLVWQDSEQEAKANLHFAKFEKMWDDRAYKINSSTTGENTPDGVRLNGDESNERRWDLPIG